MISRSTLSGATRIAIASATARIALLKNLLDLPVTLPEPIAAYATTLAAHPSVAPEDTRYRAVLAQWAETKLNA